MLLGLSWSLRQQSHKFDPWAAAALSRMTSPPANFVTRLDTGARILRAGGVLDLLDALWLCGSYSRTAARLNLCSSSYALTEFNTPTWTAWAAGAPGGFTGGGTAYLDSGANPGTNFTKASLNSASYGAWVSSELADGGFAVGDASGASMLVQPRSASNAMSTRVNDAFGIAVGVGTSIGLTAGNRSGSAARQIYRNGASAGSDTQVSTSMPATLYLLRRSSTYYPGQVSAAFAGASMTAAQHLALYRGIGAMLGVATS